MIVWLEDGLDGLGKHLQFTFRCGNWHILGPQGIFEDDVPFPKVGDVSFLEGHFLINHLKLCLTTKTTRNRSISKSRRRLPIMIGAYYVPQWSFAFVCWGGKVWKKLWSLNGSHFFGGITFFFCKCMGQSWGISLSALVFGWCHTYNDPWKTLRFWMAVPNIKINHYEQILKKWSLFYNKCNRDPPQSHSSCIQSFGDFLIFLTLM